jgi:hypothetical protein
MAMPRGESVVSASFIAMANAPFLFPAGVGLRSPSKCRVIGKTDTTVTVVFGVPLEPHESAVQVFPPPRSPAHNLGSGTSPPNTTFPEQQSQPPLNLPSEPDSNDDLGPKTTKNAAAKGSAPDPVFSGVRPEDDEQISNSSGVEGDSGDAESPKAFQNRAVVTGGDLSVRYIDAGL